MRELIVDSFAGGGGASTGTEMALGRSPDIAINHDGGRSTSHKDRAARGVADPCHPREGLSLQYRGLAGVVMGARHRREDRTMVVTPGKGFYRFASKSGGDQIALCAHVRQMEMGRVAPLSRRVEPWGVVGYLRPCAEAGG